MIQEQQAVVVDAGNTHIKVAVFQGAVVEELHSFDATQLSDLKQLLLGKSHLPSIVASVRSERETNWLRQLLPGCVLFSYQLVKNISVAYETPETLGMDRLCNASAAYGLFPGNVLTIDMGTCIKYDFTTAEGAYLGGAISPGLAMRFRAMHTLTAKLPLIDDYRPAALIGANTADALRSGVLNGIEQEVKGMIESYRNTYPDTQVVLTGGDARHFDFGKISGIFADEFLTLKGLHLTLISL